MEGLLLGLLLLILPLIVLPLGVSPFEGIKVILSEVGIGLLAFHWLSKLKSIRIKWPFKPQMALIFYLFGLSLIDLLYFKSLPSFFGNIFRLQGVFLLWNLLLFSVISKGIPISQLKTPLIYFSLVGLTLATLILGVNESDRAFGTLGEPNALAATAVFLLPLAWFRLRSRYFQWSSLLLTGVIILFSGSRAGALALSFELLFIFLIQKMGLSIVKSTLILVILIVLSQILPFVENNGWFENRSEIWQAATYAGLDYPIFGHGFGNIQLPLHQAAVDLHSSIQYQVVDSSHNFILDYWVQGGVIGLILILILSLTALEGLVKGNYKLEVTAFLGVITVMLFNPVSVTTWLAFWYLIGQGFQASELTKHPTLG